MKMTAAFDKKLEEQILYKARSGRANWNDNLTRKVSVNYLYPSVVQQNGNSVIHADLNWKIKV